MNRTGRCRVWLFCCLTRLPRISMNRTAGCRICCALASLLLTHVFAQDLSEPDWTLQSLVVLLSDAFAQDLDESDCRLQNLVRFELSSLLLRVVPRRSRQSTCQESSRCQVSSATLRSDAAMRMKFLTSLNWTQLCSQSRCLCCATFDKFFLVAAQRRVLTDLRVRCEKVVRPSSHRPQV